MKWKRLRPHQYAWCEAFVVLWFVCVIALVGLYIVTDDPVFVYASCAVGILGSLCTVFMYLSVWKQRKVSVLMENFVRRNNMYCSHFNTESGVFGERKVERLDYYPRVEYIVKESDNEFAVRIRMDGTMIANRFRDMEQVLADMFETVCVDVIEERGYLTFHFELRPQMQSKIQSSADITTAGENEIAFSDDIIWNWKKVPHLLLVGNTNSGKSSLCRYLITCLLRQGVRVIYCDPKNDDDMRLFMKNHPSVQYVTKETEIAKVVRETEEEVRLRQKDLDKIGISEAEFNPLFLLFDEVIAFAKIADRKTYEETEKRLSAIVVSGRSKRIYCGMILQRPDTSFIEGAIRDNLGCRICLGQMSEAAYKMAFGSDFSQVKNRRREIGSGLIFRQGVDSKPREFLAPYIYEGALNRE